MKNIVLAIVCIIGILQLHAQQEKFLDKEYWRRQALVDVLPHWSGKAVDETNGMFYTNLDREWKPFGSSDQSPAMIARHLFAYSSGYLFSGDIKLLNRAKELLRYLEKNAWDKQHGGWFDLLSRTGEPVKETKTTFNQVYCITGLTMYYFVTKDPAVLERIEAANRLLEDSVWDKEAGGYYDIMHRDWSVHTSNKSFSSVITPVSGYLFYLYLSTRDPQYLEQISRIMNVVQERMVDPETGWVLESYDSAWKYIYPSGGPNEVNIGHNIETAWMFLRLYMLRHDQKYLNAAKQLDRVIEEYGFDESHGCWYANVSKKEPAKHPDLSYWWIQAYGNMYQLVWYSLDQQKERLHRFSNGAKFWDNYFIDKVHGDAFQGVSIKGEPTDPVKGNLYKASYHNLENSLLSWLYLGLWVKKNKLTLYFFVEPGARHRLYPLPVEEDEYRIVSATINGKKFSDIKDGYVNLPDEGGRVEVIITSTHSNRKRQSR